MKTLALDTGTPFASAAVTENGRLLASVTVRSGNSHSEILLPAVEEMLRSSRLSPSEINLFALAVGPGSFTGVRIGASTLKGLAFGSGKPCIGVSSPEALAENFRGMNGILCPVIDARRDRMYNALFAGRDGEILRLTPDRLLPVPELEDELLREHPEEPVFLCGDGAEATAGLFTRLSPAVTPPLLRLPSAQSVALLAERRFLSATEEEKAAFTDLALAPVYLRPSQAEQERTPASARLGV